MHTQKHQSPQGAKINAGLLVSFIFAAATLGLSACNSDRNPLPIGDLRVANAISDSNPIDATVVSIPSGIDNIAFGSGSGFKDVVEGSYRVQLTTTTSSGQVTINADSTPIDKGQATTVYATGQLSLGTQATFVVETMENTIASDKSEVQFVNVASQQSAPLDIYVTAPGATLVGAVPTTTLSFPANNQPALFAPGAYEIRVTAQGNPVTVLFDSGPLGVPFAAISSQQFALLDNTNVAFPSPLSLMILTGSGGSALIQNGGS